MKKAFEILMQHEDVQLEMKNNPIYKATFLALYRFVCNGGKLEKVEWFRLAKEKWLNQLKKAA